MSPSRPDAIAAINEQLLRAIGVGIALAGEERLDIRFHNEKFGEWFGAPGPDAALSDIFPQIDVDAMRADLAEGRPHAIEIKVKPKRRTLVIALSLSRAVSDGQALLVVECQNITRIHELEGMIESYAAMVERNTREIEREKERAEKLLLNIMPKSVYEEFRTFGVVTPQLYRDVSVLMLDLIGFTRMAETEEPSVIVGDLNEIFTAFDRITEQYGCERIKTIGDAYLAVAGLPEPEPDHARAVANCAVRFIRYLERRNEGSRRKWECRIGMATGSVVGSVVGIQKYVYDIFGPAVNLSSRLQELAEPMTIIAHETMRDALIESFVLTELGKTEIRGVGEVGLIEISTAIERPRMPRFV